MCKSHHKVKVDSQTLTRLPRERRAESPRRPAQSTRTAARARIGDFSKENIKKMQRFREAGQTWDFQGPGLGLSLGRPRGARERRLEAIVLDLGYMGQPSLTIVLHLSNMNVQITPLS